MAIFISYVKLPEGKFQGIQLADAKNNIKMLVVAVALRHLSSGGESVDDHKYNPQ